MCIVGFISLIEEGKELKVLLFRVKLGLKSPYLNLTLLLF